jgi:hypothetical protein
MKRTFWIEATIRFPLRQTSKTAALEAAREHLLTTTCETVERIAVITRPTRPRTGGKS